MECTTLLRHTQYAQNDPNPGPDSIWECESISDAKILPLENLENLEEAMFAKFDSAYSLLSIPQAKVSSKGIKIPKGAKVSIKSTKRSKGSEGNGGKNIQSSKQDNFFDLDRRRLQSQPVFKTVLIVRVIATDGETSYSTEELSDAVFGTSGDQVNLASQYSACSYGQFNFVEAPNRAAAIGNAADIVNVATKVNIPFSVSDGDITMRNAESAQLKLNFDVAWEYELTNHLMICLPGDAMSGITYAFLPGQMSIYKDYWCTSVSAVSFEVLTHP